MNDIVVPFSDPKFRKIKPDRHGVFNTLNMEYLMDRLNVYSEDNPPFSGQFVDVRTFGSFAKALKDIGTTKTTLLIPNRQHIEEELEVLENIQLFFGRGGSLSSNRDIVINQQPIAGLHQIFEGVGTVIFGDGSVREVYASWYGDCATDVGICLTKAIASIAAVGGKIIVPSGCELITTVDATEILTGITIEGAHIASGATTSQIIAKLNAPVFDLTGSRFFTFRDISIYGDSTTVPTIGFLLARNSVAYSSGEHRFFNVYTDGYFSLGNVYSYGSELNHYYSCFFWNYTDNSKCFIKTTDNHSSVTSAYATIATGVQSNTELRFYACDFRQSGGTNADCLFLRGALDVSLDGCFLYNKDARSMVYADLSTYGSHRVTLRSCRFEPGSAQDYGIYFAGTTTFAYWTIEDTVISAVTKAIYSDDVRIQQLITKNVIDGDAVGIDLYHVDDSVLDVRGAVYSIRAYLKRTHIRGNSANITIAGVSEDNIYECFNLHGSDTWDPGSIADGDKEAKDVTVTGAVLGDFAVASFSLDVADLVLNAQVTVANTVTCVLSNNTGGAVDLGAGTVYVKVIKK